MVSVGDLEPGFDPQLRREGHDGRTFLRLVLVCLSRVHDCRLDITELMLKTTLKHQFNKRNGVAQFIVLITPLMSILIEQNIISRTLYSL